MTTPPLGAAAADDFVITRTFHAPRELVFKAWSEPGRLAQWWGPKGFVMQATRVDFRPGGVFHYGMASPHGHPMWGRFVYREIVAPERIVFVVSFSDAAGGITRAPFSATWPLEVLNTLTLSEHDGWTTLTLKGGPINATEDERRTFVAGLESMRHGFTGTLDQLATYLANAIRPGTRSDRKTNVEIAGNDVILSRLFDAPHTLVFKAWTDPVHIARWFGPHGFSTTVEMDAWPDGRYRIVMHSPEGVAYPLKGAFREIEESQRLVMTDNWEEHPADWHALLHQLGGDPNETESLWTVTFAGVIPERGDGQTLLTIRISFKSSATRDAMVNMGMTDGWGESLDRLDALLAAA